MSTIRVHAEVDLDDVLYELDDEDLIEELQNRGYNCSKDTIDPEVLLTKEEINALLTLIAHHDVGTRPLHWEWQRIRDKLMAMDYTK
jgi:hypothetical protein